jgi:hypothetical protein
MVEDIEDYRGFEAAIIADFDARTAVERELVLRLASLLWRLRRTTAIETDLLRIQAEIQNDRRLDRLSNAPLQADVSYNYPALHQAAQPISPQRQLTLCFQRLANLDNGAFERLGRYESAIARQVTKTLYLLQSVRIQQSPTRWHQGCCEVSTAAEPKSRD